MYTHKYPGNVNSCQHSSLAKNSLVFRIWHVSLAMNNNPDTSGFVTSRNIFVLVYVKNSLQSYACIDDHN